MITRGEYSSDNATFGAVVKHTKHDIEAMLIVSGTVVSAFKMDSTGSYAFNTNKAKEMVTFLTNGLRGCKAKNGTQVPWHLGVKTVHSFTKTKADYTIEKFSDELAGAHIEAAGKRIELEYCDNFPFPEIPYIKLTEVSKDDNQATSGDDLDSVPVRSVQEIALDKEDVTWLAKKKYYVVKDDAMAEQIFQALEKWNGTIAYDTETTGLKINCFGKIGSKYEKSLAEYNEKNPKAKIRADRLVGIIFCIEPDVSYYFPCGNRKFKNLYQTDTPERRKLIENIRARYTIGDRYNPESDMYNYIVNTPDSELRLDVLLMERVRDILEKKNLVAHNGSFEWKVGWQFEIDTNYVDDTMIMHQLMFKFRSTTSNSGEPSNLKYLSKHELGIDQWELKDFFPNFKADTKGTVREKDGSGVVSRIDFSYMDEAGTQVYAPTDGDCTLQLHLRYKPLLKTKYKQMEYIYNVEMIVSRAVAYMEFYGHKLDESKIMSARIQTMANLAIIESEIRQKINYSKPDEIECYNKLKELREQLVNESDHEKAELLAKDVENAIADLKKAISSNTVNVLNLSAPGQVADLFFDKDKLGYPMPEEKKSVAKKVIKALTKEKNPDGTAKYPVAEMYSKYKNEETLLSKFFDNLIYFQYPGGFIFSSYGQIATATGRMSCNKPNAQQYPKVITKIVVPRDGYVMADADYSQIEYRVLTALAKNEGLRKLFSDPDSDYHTLMASTMFQVPYASVTPKMRSAAKSFNFGIPYGMGLGSLAILLYGVNTPETKEKAAEMYDKYFENQPMTKKFFENVKESARVTKKTITAFNRERHYSFTDKNGNEDNARKAAALRQAGNAVIQGSAADIFKISVARNFNWIRQNKLLGKVLIINMVHDEQLMEIDAQSLNVQRALAEIGNNMQFSLPDFPPLYIGAGIGKAWGYAKGKMAEIHPVLLANLTAEARAVDPATGKELMPLYREDKSVPVDTNDVLKYFDERVVGFRRQKVYDYLSNPENWHKNIHPAIGGLINLQFNYGRGDDAKTYKGPNGEVYTDNEFLMLNIADFIKENNINAEASWFIADNVETEVEAEEEDYDDEESDDFNAIEDIGYKSEYTEIDESKLCYGATMHDMIGTFNCCLLEKQRICGLDTRGFSENKRSALIEFLLDYYVEEPDDKCFQLVFLNESNILKETGIYVKGLNAGMLEKNYYAIRSGKGGKSSVSYKNGDIDNRSQAK